LDGAGRADGESGGAVYVYGYNGDEWFQVLFSKIAVTREKFQGPSFKLPRSSKIQAPKIRTLAELLISIEYRGYFPLTPALSLGERVKFCRAIWKIDCS